MLPVPMVSPGPVAPHFDHHDLQNAVMPQMMPLASCYTGASGVT